MTSKWEPLYQNLEEANCGDLLTYDQAMELGFDLRTQYGRWMVSRARHRLWDDGRDLECVRGVGYRLICRDDAVFSGLQRSRNGIRRVRQGAHLMGQAAAVGGLTRYNQQKIEDQANRLRRSADMAARELRREARPVN